MTEKGRVVALWWSPQSCGWQATVTWSDGEHRLGTDRLVLVA